MLCELYLTCNRRICIIRAECGKVKADQDEQYAYVHRMQCVLLNSRFLLTFLTDSNIFLLRIQRTVGDILVIVKVKVRLR